MSDIRVVTNVTLDCKCEYGVWQCTGDWRMCQARWSYSRQDQIRTCKLQLLTVLFMLPVLCEKLKGIWCWILCFLHTRNSTFLQVVLLTLSCLIFVSVCRYDRSTVTSARSWRRSWVRRLRRRRSTRKERNSTSRWPPWVSFSIFTFLSLCEITVHSVHVIFSWSLW